MVSKTLSRSNYPRGVFGARAAKLHRRMFVGDIHGGTLVYWKRLREEGLRYPPCNIAEDAALIQSAIRRGKRLIRVPNDGLFVYVRHGGNAWRFEAGHFLDPKGWEPISSPRGFSRDRHRSVAAGRESVLGRRQLSCIAMPVRANRWVTFFSLGTIS